MARTGTPKMQSMSCVGDLRSMPRQTCTGTLSICTVVAARRGTTTRRRRLYCRTRRRRHAHGVNTHKRSPAARTTANNNAACITSLGKPAEKRSVVASAPVQPRNDRLHAVLEVTPLRHQEAEPRTNGADRTGQERETGTRDSAENRTPGPIGPFHFSL